MKGFILGLVTKVRSLVHPFVLTPSISHSGVLQVLQDPTANSNEFPRDWNMPNQTIQTFNMKYEAVYPKTRIQCVWYLFQSQVIVDLNWNIFNIVQLLTNIYINVLWKFLNRIASHRWKLILWLAKTLTILQKVLIGEYSGHGTLGVYFGCAVSDGIWGVQRAALPGFWRVGAGELKPQSKNIALLSETAVQRSGRHSYFERTNQEQTKPIINKPIQHIIFSYYHSHSHHIIWILKTINNGKHPSQPAPYRCRPVEEIFCGNAAAEFGCQRVSTHESCTVMF